MIIRCPELTLRNKSHKRIHNIAGQLGPGYFLNDGYGFFKVHPVPVRPVGIHGVKAVCDRYDLGYTRNFVHFQVVGVSLAVRTLVMRLRADRQFRHDADFLQRVISLGGMGFDGLKFFVCQLARLIQHLGRHADLAEIVQQGDPVILLHSIIVISQFFGQHGGILRHPCGMAVGIFVLHINNIRERMGNLPDESHCFMILLFQRMHLFARIQPDAQRNQRKPGQHSKDDKPDLFKKCVLLVDTHDRFLVPAAHGVLDLHYKTVVAPAQVRAVHRNEFVAVHRGRGIVKTVQLVGNLGIHRRIIVYITVDSQFPCVCRNYISPCLIREKSLPIHADKGNRNLQAVHVLEGHFDIDLDHAGRTGDIQVALIRQFAEGIGCRQVWQAVRQTVKNRFHCTVRKQVIR